MVFSYEKHCRKKIKSYAKRNKVYKLYSFLLDNPDFVNNADKRFRDASSSKAQQLILDCSYRMNVTDSNKFRIKCMNIKNILLQYLDHFE
jgi:hypothetical protein